MIAYRGVVWPLYCLLCVSYINTPSILTDDVVADDGVVARVGVVGDVEPVDDHPVALLGHLGPVGGRVLGP